MCTKVPYNLNHREYVKYCNYIGMATWTECYYDLENFTLAKNNFWYCIRSFSDKKTTTCVLIEIKKDPKTQLVKCKHLYDKNEIHRVFEEFNVNENDLQVFLNYEITREVYDCCMTYVYFEELMCLKFNKCLAFSAIQSPNECFSIFCNNMFCMIQLTFPRDHVLQKYIIPSSLSSNLSDKKSF